MTDDSKLVDGYKSMYEHHQKDVDGKVIEHEGEEEINETQQLDEVLPAVVGCS